MVLARIKSRLQQFALYRAMRFGWHVVTDGTFRRDYWRWLRPAPGQFQFRSLTWRNRYPSIFRYVAKCLKDEPAPRLLSFGCATGEEVFSLRQYLPNAWIEGIDISSRNIAICRKAFEVDARMNFRCGNSAQSEPSETFDAVFCMAVFQHSALEDPAITHCAHRLRFEDFERAVLDLGRVLKPGGLLAIVYSAFRFADTSCVAGFEPALEVDASQFPKWRVQFDRHNRRIPRGSRFVLVWRKTTATK